MFPAPSMKVLGRHRKEFPNTLCCLVFAPKFDSMGAEDFIPRIAYLNERSGRYIHFYCAGYAAFLPPDAIDDREEVARVTYENGMIVPWIFSEKLFARFVDELETAIDWEYRGGMELILLDPEVDFGDCLLFHLGQMVKDGALSNAGALFEDLIRFARTDGAPRTPRRFSDGKISGTMWKALVDGITEKLPKSIKDNWKSGIHYTTRDLTRTTPHRKKIDRHAD